MWRGDGQIDPYKIFKKFGLIRTKEKLLVWLQQKFWFSTTVDIIFWELWLLYQIFFSPQVKWTVIISNKLGIHEPPHELSNDLRFSILGI